MTRRQRPDKYLTRDEVRTLMETIDILEHKTAISIMLGIGCRVSELVTINAREIDLDQRTMELLDEKKDEFRPVVFGPSTANVIKTWLNVQGYPWDKHGRLDWPLFPGSGGHRYISRRAVQGWIKDWSTRAGIRLWTKGERAGTSMVSSHWMRKTFIMSVLSRQDPRAMRLVCDNTGDSPQTILRDYMVLSLDDKRELISQWSPTEELV